MFLFQRGTRTMLRAKICSTLVLSDMNEIRADVLEEMESFNMIKVGISHAVRDRRKKKKEEEERQRKEAEAKKKLEEEEAAKLKQQADLKKAETTRKRLETIAKRKAAAQEKPEGNDNAPLRTYKSSRRIAKNNEPVVAAEAVPTVEAVPFSDMDQNKASVAPKQKRAKVVHHKPPSS